MRSILAVTVVAVSVMGCTSPKANPDQPFNRGEHVAQIHYLEIVTKDVDAVCAVYAAANGLQFGDPDAGIGNARTAALPGGGMVGVRAPMHESGNRWFGPTGSWTTLNLRSLQR